jgi:hypothetical protein
MHFTFGTALYEVTSANCREAASPGMETRSGTPKDRQLLPHSPGECLNNGHFPPKPLTELAGTLNSVTNPKLDAYGRPKKGKVWVLRGHLWLQPANCRSKTPSHTFLPSPTAFTRRRDDYPTTWCRYNIAFCTSSSHGSFPQGMLKRNRRSISRLTRKDQHTLQRRPLLRYGAVCSIDY